MRFKAVGHSLAVGSASNFVRVDLGWSKGNSGIIGAEDRNEHWGKASTSRVIGTITTLVIGLAFVSLAQSTTVRTDGSDLRDCF